LFGHICWQAAYDSSLFDAPLDTLLSGYASSPFLVISSAYPVHRDNGRTTRVFKRPDMPLSYLFDLKGPNKKEIIKERKILKAKRWMVLSGADRIETFENVCFESDQDLFKRFMDVSDQHLQKEYGKKVVTAVTKKFTQPHNTINRLTGTTGEGGFAPFTVEQEAFFPNVELSIFAGISKNIQIEQVRKALSRMGTTGFGKDASTGLGKFSVTDVSEISLAKLGSEKPNACYTLSPSVPEKEAFRQIYFAPFTRFGRHGDTLAKSANPFKNPVIMADEGAVLVSERMNEILEHPYIGTGISNISKAEPKTVMQGYSLYIPVKVEV